MVPAWQPSDLTACLWTCLFFLSPVNKCMSLILNICLWTLLCFLGLWFLPLALVIPGFPVLWLLFFCPDVYYWISALSVFWLIGPALLCLWFLDFELRINLFCWLFFGGDLKDWLLDYWMHVRILTVSGLLINRISYYHPPHLWKPLFPCLCVCACATLIPVALSPCQSLPFIPGTTLQMLTLGTAILFHFYLVLSLL